MVRENFSDVFKQYIAANYPLLNVVAAEDRRALRTICKVIYTLNLKLPENRKKKVFVWDIVEGLREVNINKGLELTKVLNNPNPDQAIRKVAEYKDSIFIFINLHYLFKIQTMLQPTVVQLLKNMIPICKTNRNMMIILSPVCEIPTELRKDITVIEYGLPSLEELRGVLQRMLRDNNITISKEEEDEIVYAGKGLTKEEFENAIARSIVVEGKPTKKYVFDQKAQYIRDQHAVEIYYPTRDLDTIIGMDRLKEFTIGVARAVARGKDARGILIFGVPGVGKTVFAKSVGKAANLPVLIINLSLLKSSYVGESERRTKEIIELAKMISPCIVVADEIEKAFKMDKNVSDGGVSSNIMRLFLEFLQEPEGALVIATCNDILSLPPEFTRHGRWLAIFFVDIPTAEERVQIFEYYKSYYNLQDHQMDVDDIAEFTKDWAGAEIETLCQIASLLDCSISQAANYMSPLCKLRKEELKKLREWAKDRAVPASSKVEGETVYEEERSVLQLI